MCCVPDEGVESVASLDTEYLGLSLESPLVVAASPLLRDADTARHLADGGAGALVMFSLFEEQFAPRPPGRTGNGGGGSARVEPDEFLIRPHGYIEQLQRLKETVDVPVIASLNISRAGSWLGYASNLERAGADALEINIYHVASPAEASSESVEETYLEILRELKSCVSLPIALKLTPYFTSFLSLAMEFDRQGADGLVLFNRFYQPDIDIENLRLTSDLQLSTSGESRLAQRWIAMLKGRVAASLAATGGVHTTEDVIKVLMAGADVAMLCSVLLKHGVERLASIKTELEQWLDSHGYPSVDAVRGIMSEGSFPDPERVERAGYAKVINRYW